MDKPASVYDNRVVERKISAGLLTPAEYQAYLESLEDCGDNAVETSTQFIRTESADADYEED